MPPSTSQPQTPPSSSCCDDPEYIAIILAASQGARLFPLTSEYPHGVPKHLLPLSPLNPTGGTGTGGAPLLQRLLIKTYESGFDMVVVAIHKEDEMTVPFLLGKGIEGGNSSAGLCKVLGKEHEASVSSYILAASSGAGDLVTDLEFRGLGGEVTSSSKPTKSGKGSQSAVNKRWMHVRVVRLPEECHGSADALRFLSGGSKNDGTAIDEENNEASPAEEMSESINTSHCYIPRTSHAVVMPGDLIMEGSLLTVESDGGKPSNTSYDGNDILSLLVASHRRWNASGFESSTAAGCTMLLTDVGAEDKEGIPLKESSKAKMGLLSREEEDMEYIGLSSEIPSPLSGSLASLSYSKSSSDKLDVTPSRRVVLKRSKLEVEEDEGTGSTPKLSVAKNRLHSTGGNRSGKSGSALARLMMGGLSQASTSTTDHSPTISLRTDLHDVHLYVISNWVFDLLHARPSMQSFQNEVLPLLISRQFRGVEAAFGPTSWQAEENRERLQKVLRELDGIAEDGTVTCTKVSTLLGMYASGKMSGGLGSFIPKDDEDDVNPASDEPTLDAATPKAEAGSSLLSPPAFPTSKHRFVVSAQVLSRDASSVTLRACTLPSLLYGCSEITSRTLKLPSAQASSLVTPGARLNTKFNSILLPDCTMGEKVQTKSCTIGANVTVGDRSKLNNVVVMDGATIGNNTVLQNSVVGVGAKIGENCNLKDCQVGPGAVVPAATKTTEKGEAFHV